MIKRFFLTVIFLCSVLAFSKSDGGVVSGVLGLNVDCGTACQPIPLNVLTCIIGCPIVVGSSFTEANVLWGLTNGPLCKKSIDSGRTWSNCPDASFSTLGVSLLSNSGSITEAADGSIIAALTNTTPTYTCIIVRSTNGGTTWSIVFQNPPIRCDTAGFTTNYLVCLGTGECVLVFYDTPYVGRVVKSIDNGQTWNVVFNQSTTSDQFSTVAYNGLVGIACRFADNAHPGIKGMKFNGVWSDSSFLSTVSIFCSGGAFIFNNVPYIAGVRFDFPADRVIVDGLTGNVIMPIVLSDAHTDSTEGTVAVAYKDKAVYLGASESGTGRMGVWASLSLSGPYTKIFTGLSGMSGVAGGGGFVHPVSNCVYLYNRFNVVGFCP